MPPRLARRFVLLSLAALHLGGGNAAADATPATKRAVPRYDGRPAPAPSAGEVLVWIPRAIARPVHLLLDGGLRRPIRGLITFSEKHHIHDYVRRALVWREGKIGLLPTVLFEFGLDPSIGFYFFADDQLLRDHRLVLRGGFWHQWAQVLLDNEHRVFRDGSGTLRWNVRYVHRPDRPFHGVGAATRQSDETFFLLEKLELGLGLAGKLRALNRASLALRYRHVALADGELPAIGTRFAVDDDAVVPGFAGYDLIVSELKLELDTRDPDRWHTPGTGLRLELFGAFNLDPAQPERHFFRWGAEAAAFYDVSGVNHVLGLRVHVELVERTGSRAVPFTELAAMGGNEHMQGFLEGRFRGPSAFELTAEYRYPIWALIDASLFVGAGNAFGVHLADLHPARMHLSWGLGVRSSTERNVSFDGLLAFGSNRFDEGSFEVDHVHFLFGVNRGF